jgi:UDP-GlcNAc3NAcA epimerase
MELKILTVVGARPQFVKASALSRVFAQVPEVREFLIHTGQHYDANMSDIFFEQMGIRHPDYFLGLGGGTHAEMTGRQLEKIGELVQSVRPDWVLVYGDTNSTLAGALAAAKLHVPVAHVEAGLRSFNRRMPEEINRVVTDHLSSLLLAPTAAAVDNLRHEGVVDGVHMVGDVMYDVTLHYRERAVKPEGFDLLGVLPGDFILCTIHRAENTDDPIRLGNILSGLGHADIPVLLPLHPRTKSRLAQWGIEVPPQIRIIDPVGYLEMQWLEAMCRGVATDSGGVQKEAYFHGKPCITLREETEWVELVSSGANVLVGTDVAMISRALQTMPNSISTEPLYGDGRTASAIVGLMCGSRDVS